MGRVVSRTSEVFRANLVPFLLLGLAGAAPPAALTWVAHNNVDPDVERLLALPIALVTALSGCAVHAVVIQKSYQSFIGETASFAETLGQAMASVFPLFLLSICLGFMTVLGSLLLLIPGLMLIARWSVAGPTLMVEQVGVFESMGRSAELTRGRRWPVFGLLFAYALVVVVIELFVWAVTGASTGSFGADTNSGPLATIGDFLVTAVTQPLSAAGATAIYLELRGPSQGAGSGELASIFD
jgi:hypothetical protein